MKPKIFAPVNPKCTPRRRHGEHCLKSSESGCMHASRQRFYERVREVELTNTGHFASVFGSPKLTGRRMNSEEVFLRPLISSSPSSIRPFIARHGLGALSYY